MRVTEHHSTRQDASGTVVDVEVHIYRDNQQAKTATRHAFMKSGRIVTSPHLPGPITLQPAAASTSFP